MRLAAARVAPGRPVRLPPRRLRLVGAGEAKAAKINAQHTAQAAANVPQAQQITDEHDPRWVLAVRTAACLQGAVLPPEKRDHLLRVGRSMGLSPFDSNLVIAIIQDQARRGQLAEYCPQAGAAQLAMVPKPRRFAWRGAALRNILILAASIVALQAALIAWLLN